MIARGAGTGRPATRRPWALGVALPAPPPCTPGPGPGSQEASGPQFSVVGGAGGRCHALLDSRPPRRLSGTGSTDATRGLSDVWEALQSAFVLNLSHHADPSPGAGTTAQPHPHIEPGRRRLKLEARCHELNRVLRVGPSPVWVVSSEEESRRQTCTEGRPGEDTGGRGHPHAQERGLRRSRPPTPAARTSRLQDGGG